MEYSTAKRLVLVAGLVCLSLGILMAVLLAFGSHLGGIYLEPDQSFGVKYGPVIHNNTQLNLRVFSQNLEGLKLASGYCPIDVNLVEGNYRLPETLSQGQSYNVWGRTTQDFVIGVMTVCMADYAAAMIVSQDSTEVSHFSSEQIYTEAIAASEAAGIRYFAFLSGLSYGEYVELILSLGHQPMPPEYYANHFIYSYFWNNGLRGLPLEVQ